MRGWALILAGMVGLSLSGFGADEKGDEDNKDDQAKEACPAYPARTEKRHVSFPDPTGKPLEEWRKVRDALGRMARFLVEALKEGRLPSDEELRQAARL